MTAPPGADPAVVVAGDALVDLTPTTTVGGTPAYEPHPGGSCLNVAVGLARLEVPTAFLARVSSDAFGQLLREHLAASGVLPTYLIDTDDLTTLAAVHLRDGQATYSFHAAGAADRGLQPEHLAALPDGARCLPEPPSTSDRSRSSWSRSRPRLRGCCDAKPDAERSASTPTCGQG